MITQNKISVMSGAILFILSLTLLTPSATVNAATFYVATNGTNTSPYDTWAKAATSIQTAIDAASDSDTIMVGSSDGYGTGTYTENIIVNKEVTIESENGYATTTVIASSANSHVFEVTSDDVTITGFSIYGATGSARSAVYCDTVDNCTVQNSRCGWDGSYKNYRGIHLVSSTNCTITNTTTSYNDAEGIFLASSTGATLTSNTASNNSGDGITLDTSSSNTLTGNTANSNTYDGIRLEPTSNDNTLTNNTASSNGNNGILIAASTGNELTGNTTNSNVATHGIILTSSSNNNTLDNNTADYNEGNGIRLENSCSGNTLTSNTVTHNEFGIFLSDSSNNTIDSNIMNDNDGRWDGDGIMLWGSHYNTISNNTANNDPGDGIEFYDASNNNVINNTVINSGWGIRINYHCSHNVLSNNTVNDGVKGIVVEQANSTNNTLSNNTTNNNSEDGIYLYDDTSDNIVYRNTCNGNTNYGIHLNSSSGNFIYLNNTSSNSTSNVYSQGGSTNTWYSPTTIYYDYNSGTLYKWFLGNYYSDGTHSGSNGTGGTYTIPNDNDDDYQLIDTSDNFSLQAWWLNSDNNMYRDNAAKAGSSVTIPNGGNHIWIAEQAASSNISFAAFLTWTGQLVLTSAPTSGHTFTLQIGSSTDGSDFTAGGPEATLTGDGSSTRLTFSTNASAFTVTTGNFLAVRITSNHAEYSVRTGGAWSYVSSTSEYTPTVIDLVRFEAFPEPVAVRLEWETASETDNLGFRVWRSEQQESDFQPLTENLIPAEGSPVSGAEYSFEDSAVMGGIIYWYKLEAIDSSGASTFYGPVSVARAAAGWDVPKAGAATISADSRSLSKGVGTLWMIVPPALAVLLLRRRRL